MEKSVAELRQEEITCHKHYKEFVQLLRIYFKRIPACLNFFFFKDFCSKTQADKVYWHLQEFGTITNTQCREIYGINHAPSVIKIIRQRLLFEGDKYRIENETKKGCNRFGKPTNWDVYKLVPHGGEENELKMSA